MEREGKSNERASSSTSRKSLEPEFLLQWGKRLRCVRVKNPNFTGTPPSGFRRKITSRIVNDTATGSSFSPFNDLPRASEDSGKLRSSQSPEKYYTTRGMVAGAGEESGGGGGGGIGMEEKRGKFVLPKLYISLSSKEKEEDFLAMKGCKLPQRPKKRAKFIQRTLRLVSPGAWLSDMCQERYEVREKKTSRKRSRGLKAMGTVDSDSE